MTQAILPNIVQENIAAQAQTITDIQKLESLAADWDGQDAPAISKKCLQQAQDMITGITKYLNNQTLPSPLPIPRIEPTSDEGVTLNWRMTGDLFVVIIEPDEITLQRKQSGRNAKVSCLTLEQSVVSLAQAFSDAKVV